VFITSPLGEEECYCYLENWSGFSVNENCANKEWAVEFMRFLMTQEEINKLASIKGLPSVAVESDEDRFIGLYTGSEEYRCTIDEFFPINVQDALWVVAADMSNGKITVDEATAELERRIRENDMTERN